MSDGLDQPPCDCDCCCGSVVQSSIVFTVCDMTTGEALRADLECPYNDPIAFGVERCVWPPLPDELL